MRAQAVTRICQWLPTSKTYIFSWQPYRSINPHQRPNVWAIGWGTKECWWVVNGGWGLGHHILAQRDREEPKYDVPSHYQPFSSSISLAPINDQSILWGVGKVDGGLRDRERSWRAVGTKRWSHPKGLYISSISYLQLLYLSSIQRTIGINMWMRDRELVRYVC